jgi:hypothetical protein
MKRWVMIDAEGAETDEQLRGWPLKAESATVAIRCRASRHYPAAGRRRKRRRGLRSQMILGNAR